VSTIGFCEFARHTSAVVREIETKKEPALIMRRVWPVAYMLPLGTPEFDDFALAHAPEFVEAMAAADAEVKSLEVV
jgi:PHD/YefM family antitoxin component YafN of YafNO toxin-antitoxin module